VDHTRNISVCEHNAQGAKSKTTRSIRDRRQISNRQHHITTNLKKTDIITNKNKFIERRIPNTTVRTYTLYIIFLIIILALITAAYIIYKKYIIQRQAQTEQVIKTYSENCIESIKHTDKCAKKQKLRTQSKTLTKN